MAYDPAEVEAAIEGLRAAFAEAERRNTWAWIADAFYTPDATYFCPYGGVRAAERRLSLIQPQADPDHFRSHIGPCH